MEWRRILISLSLAAIAVTTVFIYTRMFYLDIPGHSDSVLIHQLEQLQEESRKSLIIKRVSEQMEQVAYQQKDISDSQRQEAIARRQEAERLRKKAESEARKALEAQHAAERAYEKAEEQKKIAELRREEALAAQRRADTLAALALGRSLGTLSVNRYLSGENELAALLGYYAWKFTKENRGDCYLPEIFNSLSKSAGVSGSLLKHQGALRDLKVIDPQLPEVVSVSQSGEIIVWEGQNLIPRVIYKNGAFDFRKVAADRKNRSVYALTRSGMLLKWTKEETVFFDVNAYGGLAATDDGKIIVCRDSTLLGLSYDVTKEEVFYNNDCLVTILCASGQDIWFGDISGKVMCVGACGSVEQYLSLRQGKKVTAIAVDTLTSCVAVGYEDGIIVVSGKNGVRELSGHFSQVTGLAFTNGKLLSAGYDCTLRLWDTHSVLVKSVMIETYSAWIYSVVALENHMRVLCGGESGSLNQAFVSPDYLAECIRKKMKRDFTPEERRYYIGMEKGGGE